MPDQKTKPFPCRTTKGISPRVVGSLSLFAFLFVGLIGSNLQAWQNDTRDNNSEYQAYKASLDEWKSTFLQIYKIRYEFDHCDEFEADALREQYRELKAKGDKIAYETMDKGAAAFSSLEQMDNDLLAFLDPLPERMYAAGKYDRSQAIGRALLTKKQNDGELAFNTIRSAFYCNRFDVAKKLIDNWKKNHGELPANLKVLDSFTERLGNAWNKELELREKEDKEGNLPRIQFDTDKGPIIVELFEDNAPIIVHNLMWTVEKTQTMQNMPFFTSLQHQFAMTGCKIGDGTRLLRFGDMTTETLERKRIPFRGTVSLEINPDDSAVLSGLRFNRIPQPDYEETTLVVGRVIKGMDIVDSITNTHTVTESQAIEPVPSVKPDRLITTLIDRKPEGKSYDKFIEQRKKQ